MDPAENLRGYFISFLKFAREKPCCYPKCHSMGKIIKWFQGKLFEEDKNRNFYPDLILQKMIKIGDLHLLKWFCEESGREIDYKEIVGWASSYGQAFEILAWSIEQAKVRYDHWEDDSGCWSIIKASRHGQIRNMKLLIVRGYQSCICIFEQLAGATDDVELLEWVWQNLDRSNWSCKYDECTHHRYRLVDNFNEVEIAIISGNINVAKWFMNKGYDFSTYIGSEGIIEDYPFAESDVNLLLGDRQSQDREDCGPIRSDIRGESKSKQQLNTSSETQLRKLFNKIHPCDMKYTFLFHLDQVSNGTNTISNEFSNVVYTILYLALDCEGDDMFRRKQLYDLCGFMILRHEEEKEESISKIKWYYARSNLTAWRQLLKAFIFDNSEDGNKWAQWIMDQFFMDKMEGLETIIIADNLSLFTTNFINDYYNCKTLVSTLDPKSPKILEYCFEQLWFVKELGNLLSYHASLLVVNMSHLQLLLELTVKHNLLESLVKRPILYRESISGDVVNLLLSYGLTMRIEPHCRKHELKFPSVISISDVVKPSWL